jgi:nitroalkane oxidase
VDYALVDAKTMIEATRYLTWRACHVADAKSPAGAELAMHSKIYGSEVAMCLVADISRVGGVERNDREGPLGNLMCDASTLLSGGNLAVRRRQLHALLKVQDYDPVSPVAAPKSFYWDICLA